MDTAIYVLSGTGTSLAAATIIGSTIKNSEVISIPRILAKGEEILVEARKIGLIFPCYFATVPEIVLEFVRKAKFRNAEYIFSVITCGGNQGICTDVLKQELVNKGLDLNYGKSIRLSSNYIVAWYYKNVCRHGPELISAMESFRSELYYIADDVSNENEYVEKGSRSNYRLSRFLSTKKILENTKAMDIQFTADDKCVGCGTCARVCPVQNIKLVENRPEYQHKCMRCMACIQYCPQKAIRFSNKELNRPRYFYPDFPANKIARFNNPEQFSI